MNYRKRIDPELRPYAVRVPYNRFIIGCANLFLRLISCFTRVPKGIDHRRATLEVSGGRKLGVEVFEPSGSSESLPVLVYIHGGAFSFKASPHQRRLACIYAEGAGCRVYFPDYRLTPKYPYPAAYDDVVYLYKTICGNSKSFPAGSGIGLAGDSAGGAIAALIGSSYEREGLIKPCCQMLIYPVTDADMRTESMREYSDTPFWSSKSSRRMWQYYLKSCGPDKAANASPMHCSLPHAVPDTYIETAQFDCLRDEGILYAKKLRDAGVDVVINETKGTFHGYDAIPNTQKAAESIERRVMFLKRCFGRCEEKA